MIFAAGDAPTTVIATYGGPGRKLLPAASDMTVGETWTSSHTEAIEPAGSGFVLDMSFAMVFEVTGSETVTTPAGTFDTMVIQATYTATDTTGMLYETPVDGVDTMWYANGIGIVQVEHVREPAPDAPMILFQERTLNSFGGLTTL